MNDSESSGEPGLQSSNFSDEQGHILPGVSDEILVGRGPAEELNIRTTIAAGADHDETRAGTMIASLDVGLPGCR